MISGAMQEFTVREMEMYILSYWISVGEESSKKLDIESSFLAYMSRLHRSEDDDKKEEIKWHYC